MTMSVYFRNSILMISEGRGLELVFFREYLCPSEWLLLDGVYALNEVLDFAKVSKREFFMFNLISRRLMALSIGLFLIICFEDLSLMVGGSRGLMHVIFQGVFLS